MRTVAVLLIVLGGAVAALCVSLRAGESKKDEPQRRAFGIDKRVPWTTSRVKGSPEPPAPYRSEVAFPKLKFFEPLDMARAAGSDRLFVAERPGRIYSFPNDRRADKADLLLDLKKTVYAITLHPQFAKNGYLFVTYILDPKKDEPEGTRLSRFKVTGDPPRADPASEKIILTWPSGGHNGGCLKFGLDGFLYIGTGDGSGIADELHTGQNPGDLLASMLRIDVDNPDPGKNYGIPKDNPFVGMKGARPEVWAYGLRQPWRYSFDRKTGDLWVGEVGQDLWESVIKVEKGGNYGWSVMEGTHPFRPERKRGPTPILKPIVEHPHSDFRSLTGGYVYHGKRLKDLVGAYIYGDFDTGRIWALRHDGKKVTWHQELVTTSRRIVSWGEDNAGELYFLDWMGGQVHRLVPAPKTTVVNNFPRKLSETGLFASVKDHKPAPGLIPYSVNAQLWSDGAHKERFLALPGTSKIEFETVTYPQPAPGAPPGWRFPDGTVVVKTFFLDMENGNPKSRRRLETRILHFEQLSGTEEVGDQYWHGYTYVWNDEQTEAELLDAKGLDRTFTIKDAKAPGGERKQTYHFPSRAECTLCHTMPAKFALGVNTLQMNKDHDYGGVVANQLATLEHLGIFTKPLPKPPEKLPRLYDPDDERVDLDKRARSYLHANCAHCHMKWGGGNAEFQLLATMPLNELGIVGTRAAHGAFEITDARVLSPGHPERSLIAYRMNKLGLGRMPHVASSVVDEKAVQLVRSWIKQLPEEGKRRE
ncbi:MAG: PQQ-dependent sugar dehydrogenase [Planctomycetes bacterium]|nr:PQQ-dependent sugar dehydrogenase [Planctomycetota bacterium]